MIKAYIVICLTGVILFYIGKWSLSEDCRGTEDIELWDVIGVICVCLGLWVGSSFPIVYIMT